MDADREAEDVAQPDPPLEQVRSRSVLGSASKTKNALGQISDSLLIYRRYFRADISPICLICVAHVAGWEKYYLHNLGHVSWVESVLVQILHSTSERQVRIR